MSTYRALQLQRFAPTVRAATEVVSLPWRDPAPGEIAVRNLCCGVNGIFDTQIARNAVDYVRVALPSVMGVEALGVVQAVGADVEGFVPGDAVVTVRFRGGYREGNIGPAADFIPVAAATPEWLALASTGVSAWLALNHLGQAQAGETVAISAAAGGLGHLLVQLAKLRGCRVVAICGGPVKAAFVKSLGADRVIDYRAEPIGTALARDFGDALDLAIDTVGGSTFDALLDNLAPHGRLVVGGAAQDLDGKPEIVTGPRIVHKLYYKGASVRGFMNGLLTPHWAAARAALFPLYQAGQLRVALDAQRFCGVAQVPDAVEHLLSGQSMGKVVVELGQETHA
ncbi:zinc-binding dehydrogenase [Aquabacterium sp. OR-4]|uniref:zinc-binding dehydrogenase n=1 Tax=Aquabacterium sp. OR-4 TaxID=2978127 RepID=UPI0028C5E9CE|nr:zinc-binding dehydrogenase [Aquabacterium sp. OR-4]MDT7836958.1 zinc-binding dehydrogenase [Aquabacterium sp. OR-4]